MLKCFFCSERNAQKEYKRESHPYQPSVDHTNNNYNKKNKTKKPKSTKIMVTSAHNNSRTYKKIYLIKNSDFSFVFFYLLKIRICKSKF